MNDDTAGGFTEEGDLNVGASVTVDATVAGFDEAHEQAFPARVKDKVCIVGFAESSRHETPFSDDRFEFWGLNRLHTVVEHDGWDRWFQIHDIELHHGNDAEHLAWLAAQPFPVYLRPEDMGKVELPNAQPYPFAAVLDLFGSYAGGRYLGSGTPLENPARRRLLQLLPLD